MVLLKFMIEEAINSPGLTLRDLDGWFFVKIGMVRFYHFIKNRLFGLWDSFLNLVFLIKLFSIKLLCNSIKFLKRDEHAYVIYYLRSFLLKIN
jgi:hypothetical protein